MTERIKVAILGGGLGSMSAAYYLSSTPELRAQFEVTVYQQGWRLGGKGATGRDQARGDRIYEHGLHMFMGFYDNAFSMMREVYDRWQTTPDNPLQSWRDAFAPRSHITLQEKVNDTWRPWNIHMPPRPGTPGAPDAPWNVIAYLQRLIEWLLEALQDALEDRLQALTTPRTIPEWIEDLLDGVADLVSLPGRLIGDLFPTSVRTLFTLVEHLASPSEVPANEALSAVHTLLRELYDWVEYLFANTSLSDELRHLYVMTRLGLAVAEGMVLDILPYGSSGYDRINHLDFKDWLKLHGADTEDIYWCAPIQAFYDLAFAFIDGKTQEGPRYAQVAAGTALKAMLKMVLAYKGAPLWDMRAGMGDTLFSPLYQVCRDQGVRFEFFHRVVHLGLSETGRTLERIDLWKQVEIAGGADYAPLFDVKGLPCWPSEPLWFQIEGGSGLTHLDFESAWCEHHVDTPSLELGKDFDLVVLGIPVGALPLIAGELIDRLPAWKSMVENIPTVATAAVQLWFEPDLAELGWEHPTVQTTYVHPLESWGEMSQVLPFENWPSDKPMPRAVEYLVGALEAPVVLPGSGPSDYPEQQKARVHDIAVDWLNAHAGHIWPGAADTADPSALDYSKLIDWDERTGSERFQFQYWRANVDPSERYVLSPPGSIRFRLPSGQSGVFNLFLAGDWVQTGINGGSAESAVEGGMRASQAICGAPETIYEDD